MAVTLPMFITVEACRTAFSSALSTLMANNIESRPEIIKHNNVYARRFSLKICIAGQIKGYTLLLLI